MDGQAEAVGLIGAQNPKGYLGTDAVDADEEHEQVVFVLGRKTIEQDSIFRTLI